MTRQRRGARATLRVAAAAVVYALVHPAVPAVAQAPRELTLDVRPWSVDVGVAWRGASERRLWGVAAGIGADDLSVTITPENDPLEDDYVDLEQIVRAGPFLRLQPGDRVDIDIALRLALGGVRGTPGSPGIVFGVQGGVMYGWRHVRFGPRLFIGRAWEGMWKTNVVHLDYLSARLRLPF